MLLLNKKVIMKFIKKVLISCVLLFGLSCSNDEMIEYNKDYIKESKSIIDTRTNKLNKISHKSTILVLTPQDHINMLYSMYKSDSIYSHGEFEDYYGDTIINDYLIFKNSICIDSISFDVIYNYSWANEEKYITPFNLSIITENDTIIRNYNNIPIRINDTTFIYDKLFYEIKFDVNVNHWFEDDIDY